MLHHYISCFVYLANYCFLFSELVNAYSKNLNPNSNEDNLVKIEPESTDNLNLHTYGENSTTVSNSLIEPTANG